MKLTSAMLGRRAREREKKNYHRALPEIFFFFLIPEHCPRIGVFLLDVENNPKQRTQRWHLCLAAC